MLKSLTLTNFRNHKNLLLEFDSPVSVIVGENAIGKTNIMEAIYLLATGNSFRAKRIEEMVFWEAEAGHVRGDIFNFQFPISNNKSQITNDNKTSVQVTVTRGVVQGKRVQKRLYKINGVGRRKQDLIGILPTVLFRPEDMDLLTGNPGIRRQFLNDILSQVNKEYARSIQSYEKGLKQRNKLLDLIREGTVSRTTLAFWDQLLIKEGNYITRQREELMEAINQTPSFLGKLTIMYERSPISIERLLQYQQEELAVGYTLVGPHKDDFKILAASTESVMSGRDLSIYGSRGEQRMTVLWLKEVQLSVMEKILGQRPLLLLDDVLSELDEAHTREVLKLTTKQQTIVTTTDVEVIKDLVEGKVIKIFG